MSRLASRGRHDHLLVRVAGGQHSGVLEDIEGAFVQAAQNIAPLGAYLLTRGFAFGLVLEPDGGVAAGTFLRLSLLPILPSLVWALHFAARTLRQGAMVTIRSWRFAELLAVTWLWQRSGCFGSQPRPTGVTSV